MRQVYFVLTLQTGLLSRVNETAEESWSVDCLRGNTAVMQSKDKQLWLWGRSIQVCQSTNCFWVGWLSSAEPASHWVLFRLLSGDMVKLHQKLQTPLAVCIYVVWSDMTNCWFSSVRIANIQAGKPTPTNPTLQVSKSYSDCFEVRRLKS